MTHGSMSGTGATVALILLGPLAAGIWKLIRKGRWWPIRCLAGAGVALICSFFLLAARPADFPPGRFQPGYEHDCGSLLDPGGPCQALRDRVAPAATLAALGVGLVAAAIMLSVTTEAKQTGSTRPGALVIGSAVAVAVAVAVLTGIVLQRLLLDDINAYLW